MPDQSGRFFIGTASARYANPDFESRPELVREIGRMTDLFVNDLGYGLVPGFGADLSAAELKAQLGRFLTDPLRRDTDQVVFYYTGHGVLQDRDFVLPFPETTTDLARTAVWASELANWLLRGTVVQRFLIILDTCHAGRGARVLATEAIDTLERLGGLAIEPNLAIVAGARPWEQALSGAFTNAFIAAVRHRASGGHEPPFLPLDGVVGMVRANTPGWQHARLFLVGDAVTEFLPNRRFDQSLRDLDIRTQRDVQQRLARKAERDSHVLPRAQGLDAPYDGLWLFGGRHTALRQMCQWLSRPPEQASPVVVVTGDPGSGKSALLARLYVLSDRRLRHRIPRLEEEPAETMPPAGSIVRFIHARGQTPEQVLAGLCEATGVEHASSAGELLAVLARRDQYSTVIIDAVDEASSPEGPLRSAGSNPLVDQLLVSLIKGARRAKLRLLLGTRRNLLPPLGATYELVDLDEAEYADPDSMLAYARRCLTELVPDSPYHRAPARLVDDVAAAVAEAAGKSFLVALITARSLALRPIVADPYDRGWRLGLPRLAADAMRLDLDQRLLASDATRARDLLLPLAYSEGMGLPWEDLWPRLASDLSGRRYTSEDIDWLIEHAGCYVVEALDQRRSSYRLYHESLAEHLRESRDQIADQQAIFDSLSQHTPRVPGGDCDWTSAHPYVRTHLASHAARAGCIDSVLIQPRFLLAANRSQLLAALPAAQDDEGRAAADAYRHVVHHLRAKPTHEHLSYLELATRCGRANALAEAIVASGLYRPWSTQWASWRPQQPNRPLTGHVSDVTAVAVTTLDGIPVVVTGGDDTTVRVWDLATGAPVGGPLTGHTGWIWSVVVAEVDGRQVIVTCSDDHTLRVWDLATGIQVGEPFVGHTGGVTSVAVVEVNGRPVAVSGSRDRTVRVWDIASGAPVGRPLQGHTDWVWTVVTTELYRRPVAVSAGRDGTVRVWDLTSGTAMGGPLIGHGDWVWSVAIAQVDGRPAVVSAGDDHRVRVWDLATHRPIKPPLVGHNGGVTAVAVATVNGRLVAVTGSRDATVRIWDLDASQPIGGPLTGHTAMVAAVALTEVDGRPVAVTGSRDATVRIWEIGSGRSVSGPFAGHTAGVTTVAVSEVDGRPVVISGGEDHSLRVWDQATGQPVRAVLDAHNDSVTTLALADLHGRPVLASGSDDGTVRLWDLHTAQPLGVPLMGHTGAITALAVLGPAASPDHRSVLASGSDDRTVLLWDLPTGQPLGVPLTGHTGAITALAFTELGRVSLLVTAARDGIVRFWATSTGKPVDQLDSHHTCAVLSLTVAVQDRHQVVVAGRIDGTISMWDPAAGPAAGRMLAGHAGGVNSVAVATLEGRPVIVSGSTDRTVRVWDLSTGRPVGDPLTGHKGNVTAVAVGGRSDSPVVVSGSDDGTIRVRKLHPQMARNAYTGHLGGVESLAVVKVDGRRVVVSGGSDRTLRVSDLATGSPVSRPLTGHTHGVTALAAAYLHGRPLVVSGSRDRTVRVWDLATGEPTISPLTGHTEGITAVAAAYVDGRPLVISGGRDHTVRVWNLATGRPAGRPLLGHAQAVTAVAVISLDGRPAIVSGSADCTLRVWDLATGALIGEPLSGHTAGVTAIAATDLDGTPVVASGGEDARVLLWYPASRNRLTRLRLWPGPRSPLVIGRTFPCDDQVSALAICSASQRIAVGCGTSLDFHSFDGRYTQRIEPMARILEIAFGDYPDVILGVDRGMVQLRLNDNRIGGIWLVT